MIIKSIKDGGVLYRDNHRSIKKSIEQAVKENVNLSYADLRKLDLRNAKLDGGQFIHACFWGSDLSNADASEANFHHADFRLARLFDVCFVDSIFTHCDARGASFQNIIWDSCDISYSQFSCPSFLRQDFSNLRKMNYVRFLHLGESEIVLNMPPIRLLGLSQPITLFDSDVLVATNRYDYGQEPEEYRPLIAMLYNHKNRHMRLKRG